MQRGHSNSPPRSSPARLYLSIAAGVLGFICLLVALSDLSVPSTRQVTTTASATLTVSYHYQATVLPDPHSPVTTPIACSETHQAMRATAS